MAIQDKYSSHVPHISPKSFREMRHGAIEQKKTRLPKGKEKKREIESSIVSSLQNPKGVREKNKEYHSRPYSLKITIYGLVTAFHCTCAVSIFSPILDYPFPND
jgi:hypothetical protein